MSNDAFEWKSNPEHHEAQERMAHLDAYYAWTSRLFGESLEGPAVDAGAGSGHFSAMLSQKVSPILLLEGGQENLDTLHSRFRGSPAVSVKEIDLNHCVEAIASFGARSIFTLDVLEHLEDDRRVLSQFQEALPPGGKLYIKVPALQSLYGPVDEASGHFRRYSRRTLRAAVESAGFRVLRCHYMNFAGVLPYFIKSRILKRRQNFSRTFNEQQIKRIASLMPWLEKLDRILGPPLGLSLICVAEKAEDRSPPKAFLR
ncbi:class I SAM-dependent methyltransferase [Luteimonas viscosa]|uniref:Class I SAM-dependent methyltransferase n=1 Tax=Luteimonas viscosa TaxID=1132694 RepID=A0A5D4XW93_9GAMM|nr:class I SAM-dependent methyltransferase [Luteimonas viscosa]TYT27140.1 class I SAM-dependent methyltransferase [Luteimonas viscosa]